MFSFQKHLKPEIIIKPLWAQEELCILKFFKNINLLRTPVNGYVLSTKSTHITHKYVSELKNIQKFYTKLMYSAGYDITCSAHTADLELPNKDGNNRVVSGIVAKSAKKKG